MSRGYRFTVYLRFFVLFMVTFMTMNLLFGSSSARAQEAQRVSNENTTAYLPLVQLFARIEKPIEAEFGYALAADEIPAIVECSSDSNHHPRIWIEHTTTWRPLIGDKINLKFNFNDTAVPEHTYLPNAESVLLAPASHWQWQVKEDNGVDLNKLIDTLEKVGPSGMANTVRELRSRQAIVEVFTVNRSWFWWWKVPTECGTLLPENDIYKRWQQFSAEIWRTESLVQAATGGNITQLMLPLVIQDKGFYTDTADAISGSGFNARTLKFEEVRSACVSYDMHFTANNGNVIVVKRDDVDTVETKDTGTEVVLTYFWWIWYKTWGSGEYSRYVLYCRDTYTTDPMWQK